MHAGYHIMSWRRHKGLTQSDLADLARLSRPYISRLEKGQTDPALSVLRRLAVALDVTIGQMIEGMPQERILSREEMDRMARGALRPGTREALALPETRILASMIRDRRQVLGLRKERKKNSAASTGIVSGVNASRWLRASLGEKQWDALLRRIDKLASRTPEPL